MTLKSLRLLSLVIPIVLNLPARVAAQDKSDRQQVHHYKLVDLGTLGGPQSIIFGNTGPLNNQGALVDCADTSVLDPHNPQNPYFLYPNNVLDPYIQHGLEWRSGVKTDLGSLPGGSSSCTQWINDQGVVVGGSTNGALDPLTGYPEVNAVIWERGTIRNLGTLSGNESWEFAINNRGDVAGWALNAIPDPFTSSVFAIGATQARAVRWSGGVIQDLGTLGGPDSAAFFENEKGQVIRRSLINSP